mmetsp:Transcript_36567/g.62263  ORF Transcript_36567/g.62263 Transcript_36567/m.62263 type:complete len:97 (+) Transcript_36567:212-502(+)
MRMSISNSIYRFIISWQYYDSSSYCRHYLLHPNRPGNVISAISSDQIIDNEAYDDHQHGAVPILILHINNNRHHRKRSARHCITLRMGSKLRHPNL